MNALQILIVAPLMLVAVSAFAADLEEAMKLVDGEKHEAAVKALRDVVEAEPANASAWYWLGREQFLAGEPGKSVEAFDRYVALQPAAATRQWERGISCYYAGQFKAGAKQFADYQTYHAADVENAAWRFLCTAKTEGVEAARKEILPIEGDRRVPMMEIYGMFQGEQTPDEVLKAAHAGDPGKRTLDGRLFYAHLYIGLYEEARGNADAAKEHILKAAALSDPQLPVNRYMWDVARVHAARFETKEE